MRTPDCPLWHGYGLAVIMLVISMVQSIAYEQYYYQCVFAGLAIRTSMVGMVYKKVRNKLGIIYNSHLLFFVYY